MTLIIFTLTVAVTLLAFGAYELTQEFNQG